MPGVAALVAGAALVFQAPQLVDAVARGCVTPGIDGPNAALTGVVNTYYPATASAVAGATTISVGARIAGGSPTIAVGDLLLIVQMQDEDINGANSIAYGDGATGRGTTALRQTGLYEYVMAASALGAGPGVVTIAGSGAGNGLVNAYDFSAVVTATHGFRTFQVIRVPQYSSATLGAGLTAAPWNGTVHAGGVLAIDVAGALNLNAQTISVDQLGFKGGLGVAQAGAAGGTGTDYVVQSGLGFHGYKGEGVAGTPRFLYDAIGVAAVNGAADGYPNGDAARGAPGTAGGGGTDSHPVGNDENSGGGGGANGGQGGLGGNTWNTNQPVGGLGGAAFPAAVTRVVLGGGGGAGTRNNSATFASSGGTGGGIVMIRTGSMVGAGTISANGGTGFTPVNDGGGGGGAGGSVVVTTNTGNVNGVTIRANGGRGTDAWPPPPGPTGSANYHGPGGGGGGGVIITSNALPPAQTSVLGGVHGTTTVDLATYGSVSGSAGLVQTATPAAIPGSSSGAECLPVLTVAKTTSTPNVTNTVAGTTATYSITVSNAANTAAATSVNISDALPAGFTYASTGSVVLNGGATQPATVNPTVGDTNPVFGTFTIPASGSVVITFTVNVAATVAPGTYSNPATATYLDPTRTTIAGTTSAGYPGGGAERVTVHAADMTIAKSHVDPLVRGTTSTYTLTATNSGNVATSGTVTVTDTLPAGLTPTGAAGAGWTCPAPVGQTVTCTRADVLAAGSSYPPITVTVSVLQSSPNSVTNQASVSGGGETFTANDTASDATTIVSLADIGLTKTVSSPTPNQNTPVTFTITATNHGPSTATGVVVSDVLPAGLTFGSATPSAGTAFNSGVWTIGTLANGSSATLQIVATVTGTTPVTNTASKTAETETDPVAGNNSASATVTGQSADIAITKGVSNATPNFGTPVTFTITAGNNGPTNATGVKVTDLLPGVLAFVSAAPSVGTYSSVTGVWNIGALANGVSATLSIVATVNTTTATLNTATKTAEDQPDSVAANDSASATVTGQAADIAILKTVSNPTPNFGASVIFTITATNNGPSTATGVQVTDSLPAGLTFGSAAPTQGIYTQGTGIWDIGSLANGGSASLAITATVNTTLPATNTATKTAEAQPDPVAGNNTASATINPVAADIAITKTVSNTTPNQNTNITFTITATNNGPSNASGVHVNDLLPAGLNFVSAVPSVGTYDQVSGDWNIGALANGANTTLSITATVTGTSAVTNTANKSAETQPDPVPGNNSASATVTGQAADIALTKSVDNPTPNLNGNVTFTITARNNGPNNATGVQITDTLPAGLTFVSSTPSAGTSYNSGTGVWNIGALANAANATVSIVATVTSTTPITNTATKTAEDQPDPVAGNNSASATVTPVWADIAVAKTVDNSTPAKNSNVTFTITAVNNGPSNATGVQVTDLLPVSLLKFVSATPSGATTYDRVTGIWNIGALANGSTATLTIVATVKTSGSATNTATVTAEDQVDPVPGNNSASSRVACCIADIAVTKVVSNPTPNFGANVTYTVTATDNGPSDATGLQLTDQLPAGLTFVSSAPSVGTYNSGSGVWDIGTLANGTSATLGITATVNTLAATTNTAAVTAEVEADRTARDDSASATINPVAADIAVTKTVNNTVPIQNTNVTFTITATNNGPNNATGVIVTDKLPAGLNYVSSAMSVGAYDPVTGIWNIGAMANGTNGTLSIVAKVTGNTPVTNTATKTAETQSDPVPGNDTASATVTGQAADIAMTKIVNNPAPGLGSNVIFTVTAANNGPSNATGVQVTDVLPAGLAFVSALPSAGTYNSVTGIWNIGPLANGTSATLAITATVNTTLPATNTATKTAEDQADSNPGNDSASAAINPVSADIALTKTVSNTTPNQNTNVTFTITATNNGPSNASGVHVNDLLPAGLTFVSAAETVGTYDQVSGDWNIGALTNGANGTLSIVATVTGTAAVTNTATKSAEVQSDPVPGNNSASATLTGQGADIALTKTVDNATPSLGSNVIFTITAENNGPSNATGVQVTDSLPAGLTFVSAAASAGAYNAGSGIWNIGALANGANVTLSITATINTTAPITNTAAKTAEDQPDPVAGNNSASATVTPVSADIAITKSVDNPTPNLNTNVTFTVTATNNGPSNATGVKVSDVLPGSLTFISAVASVGTYDSVTGIWTIGAIANGSNATLSIVVKVTGLANSINTATKSAEDQVDPVTSNDSASSRVACCLADIAVTKAVDVPSPNFGSNVIFTVTAKNNGPQDASGLQLTDKLPAGLTFVSAAASGITTYDPVTGIWDVGGLTNGSTATLAITATVNTLVPTTNTATKTAENEADNTAGDDSASATINPVAADIAVTKTVSNTVPNQNTNVTFTITATNNGPNNATGVIVTDKLPVGLTYVSSALSVGAYDPVTGIWNIGAMANGANGTLSIVAKVTGTSPVINTATKTAETQSDQVPGNNTASATVTGQAADIALTKTVSNATPNLGSMVTFTVTATNNGPSDATGVQVTDLLPAGLTFASAVPSVGTYNSVSGIWNIGPLVNGVSATLAINATVNTTAVTPNTASKTAEDQTDPVAGNNSATAVVTGQAADIAISKTVSNTTPNQNTNVTFTITASNNGPSDATGVQVTDVLPAGLTLVTATPSVGTYSAGVWNIGPLANGTSATLSIVATVTTTASTTNTATKTAEDQPDPAVGNNSASATVTGQAADISINKAVDKLAPDFGTNVTFTVTAHNNGPSNATGVQVTDLLPAGLALVSATPSAGTYNPGTGVWDIGSLANASSATLVITATVNTTAATTNTATKTAENQLDSNPGNDSASAAINPVAADIAITKTVSNTTPNQNTNVTFTITATNNGPSNASGVHVNDLLPLGLSFVSASATVGSYDQVSGDWNIGALINGANGTLSIVAKVTGTATVTNTANKSAETQPDPVSGNNSASATVTGQGADIAITKSVDNPTPVLGTNVTFTVTAHNNGPSDATGVQVTDSLPAGLTYVSSVASVGTTYNSGSGIWNIGSLANGISATLSITATVNTTAARTNTATRTAGDQPDPVAGNDSAVAIVNPLSADIAITKSVDNPTPALNSNVTFTVTATNNGPSNATGVKVSDVLPAELTFVSAVASVGSYDSVTGVWTIGAIPSGTNATLSIVAKVTGLANSINTATKSAEDQVDPVTSNDSAASRVACCLADIVVTKTVDVPSPNFGSNVIFTVTAHNNGPQPASGLQLNDKLPVGLVYVSSGPSLGTSYTPGSGLWDIGGLASGSTATLTITATVNTLVPTTNTATKTAENEADNTAGDDSASATINPVAADIAITKTVSNTVPNQNTNVTFTITATNNGPNGATGVIVTDKLPVGLNYVSSAQSVGAYDPVTGIWNIGAMANGANGTLSIVATVTGTTPVTNTATKTGETQSDPVPGNNSASATVTGQAADIALTKTVSNATPSLGSMVTFTVTATNNGPSDATGLQVTDLLPAGLTFVLGLPSVGTYNSVTGIWNIGALASGTSGTLAITATVNTTIATTNTATRTAGNQPDSNPLNDSSSASINPVAADVAITKTVSNTTPNQNTNVTFTITARNNGPSDATGVKVTDVLPAGLTLITATPSAGTYIAGIWDIGLLVNGTNATLSIVATVTGTTPVINTATKTAELQPDPVAGNNTASATVTGQAADIAIVKAASSPTVGLNSNVIFVVTATNNGPSDATGVQVTDSLPAGLAFVSATPSAGTSYSAGTGVWTIGALANGAQASLSIVARVTTTTPATNTATRTAEDQTDPVPANDSASATVTGASADIGVIKTVNTSTPTLGQNVTYTMVAHNLGPSTATGVQLSDLLPSGVTFVSYTATQGAYNSTTGVWFVGTMVNGSTVTLSLLVTITSSGAIVNTVRVVPGNYFDPNLSNNVSSVTVDPLPGLPNTSAPDGAAGTPRPAAPQRITGLLLTILAVVAGLGGLGLAGFGRRRSRARFGQRRSRSSQRPSPGRLAGSVLAVGISLVLASLSVGELASFPSAPSATVAGVARGTQMIGSKVVAVEPPAAPKAETFNQVAGPITPSRLRIPSIGVDAWIGAVGLRGDGSMDVPNNLWTSSWLATGPRPGQAGKAVIAGHRGVGSPALFSHLENVHAGDRIYVSDAAGNEIIYQVTRVASLDLSASTQVAVFGPSTPQQLVLITCFGRYMDAARTYDHRLVVFSTPLPPAS